MNAEQLAGEIRNAAWWVRNARGRTHRAQAITRLGATVAGAFRESGDYEPLLYAVAIGLYDRHDKRFD